MSTKKAAKPAAGSMQKIAKPAGKKLFSLKPIGAKAPVKPAAPKAETGIPVTETASPFAIETGIPVPPIRRRGGGNPSPYPFKAMHPGQSFFVASDVERGLYTSEEEANAAEREECAKLAGRLTGAVRRYVKKAPKGVKFSVRTVSDPHGVRVWRTDGTEEA